MQKLNFLYVEHLGDVVADDHDKLLKCEVLNFTPSDLINFLHQKSIEALDQAPNASFDQLNYYILPTFNTTWCDDHHSTNSNPYYWVQMAHYGHQYTWLLLAFVDKDKDIFDEVLLTKSHTSLQKLLDKFNVSKIRLPFI